MQNHSKFGILPRQSVLLELIVAHGLPAFLEGISDALIAIGDDPELAARAQATPEQADWAKATGATLYEELSSDYSDAEGNA